MVLSVTGCEQVYIVNPSIKKLTIVLTQKYYNDSYNWPKSEAMELTQDSSLVAGASITSMRAEHLMLGFKPIYETPWLTKGYAVI